MTSPRLAVPVVLAFALAGCGGSYQVVHLPQYGADLYPLSQTKGGVTIAVDEIKSPERAERYFGTDLIKEGVLPVSVVVSNYGKQPVIVKPSDILLHRGKEILDPLPLEWVVATATRQHSLRSGTEKQVARFFESASFKEMVVAPSDTYRGVIFFAAPTPKTTADRFFTALSIFREGGPRIRVGLTNLDTGERVLFGPFSLASEKAGLFSSSY